MQYTKKDRFVISLILIPVLSAISFAQQYCVPIIQTGTAAMTCLPLVCSTTNGVLTCTFPGVVVTPPPPPPPPVTLPVAPVMMGAIQPVGAQEVDVTVTWAAGAGGQAANLLIQRSLGSAVLAYSTVGTVPAPASCATTCTVTYADVASASNILSAGSVYYYQVLASNSAGNSPPSNATSLTFAGMPPPLPPTGSLCTPASTGLPTLSGTPGVTLPLLPQACYQPPYPIPTSTVTVTAGSASDLQAKLSTAVCGEQIIVPANAIYAGQFTYGLTNEIPFGWYPNSVYTITQQWLDSSYHLQVITTGGTSGASQPVWNDNGGTTTDGTIIWQDKGLLPQYCPTNPVLVVSSNIANLPVGQVISQSATPANVPTLAANGSQEAMVISEGVAGLYFAGIEFTMLPGAGTSPIVGVGGMGEFAYLLPSYITFDRVLVHPYPCSALTGIGCDYVQAGIDLNGNYATVEYSNIWGIINTGQDTNAVSVANGAGPTLIAANYLEASGENVYFVNTCSGAVTASGMVTTNGTNVTWVSGTSFTTSLDVNQWTGAPITINGVKYTVQSVQSASSLTLTTSAGNQSGAVAYSVWFLGYIWPWGQPSCPPPHDGTVRLNHIKKQLSWRNNPIAYSGVVSTNGTTVTLVSGTQFNPSWGNGGIYVVINGNHYIVTAPSTATTLTLTASAGTQISVPYYEGCIPSITWGCWDVKNEFEIKSGQRILVDSNWFDTTFSEGQAGFFIWNCGINPSPAGLVCSDITIQNNLFEHGPSVGSPFGWGGYGPQNTNSSRGLIRNNLAIDISGPTWGANGYTGSVQNTKYQTFDHNTYLNTPTEQSNPFSFMFADAPSHSNIGFTWTNSLQYGQPFADSDNAGMTLADWPKNGVPVTLSGIVNVGDYYAYSGGAPPYPAGVTSLSAAGCQAASKSYPICWPQDWALVGFSDFTCGGQGVGCAAITNTNIGGLKLSASSPYKNAGTDGLDIGVNVTALIAALAQITW